MTPKHNTRDKAITKLCNTYDELQHITDFKTRVAEAKRIAIKKILDNCHCTNCQDAAYDIQTLTFY
jgi:hypothetical protein